MKRDAIMDSMMPREWHHIKSILLKEICCAENFHHASVAASALFHSRLLAENVLSDLQKLGVDSSGGGRVADARGSYPENAEGRI